MTTARQLWKLFEPVHAVTYFAEEARAPVLDLGITGFWNSYVVARAAPFGAVGPAVVTASFFGFHPKRAAAILPAVWDRLTPEQVLDARLAGATAALRGHAGDVTELADLLWSAARHADCSGRVLGAANQALPRPDDPLAAAWIATTVLREHRGDGHLAALLAHGIGPVEAMQLKIAAGESRARDLQLGRGWSDEVWSATAVRLRERGWVDGDELTEDGIETRESVEAVTDASAEQPWEVLSADQLAAVAEQLRPIAQSIATSGMLPPSNPVGV